MSKKESSADSYDIEGVGSIRISQLPKSMINELLGDLSETKVLGSEMKNGQPNIGGADVDDMVRGSQRLAAFRFAEDQYKWD